MGNSRIWLSSPHMGGGELKFVHDAFEKNWIAPLGENVDNFESDLHNYVGTKAAGALISGTAAIHLALILLGVKQGDEVICQSFTFSATANPIAYQSATPVFIDSESDTWNMCPDLLIKALEERNNRLPKAIIVVHLYGMPAKMDEILEIARNYKVPVIEDAAEALGSDLNGKKCGSFGDFSALSFNGNKIITTSGGGALLSDDNEMIDKARFLATQARDKAPHYQHSNIGYNYRMSNIIAGIGRGQMEVLDERVSSRRSIHDRYFKELGATWLELQKEDINFKPISNSKTGIYFLKEPPGFKSNRWLSTIIVNPDETEGITREVIRTELEKQNIEARPLWKPLHMQPIFESYPVYKNGFSDWLFENGLCLPSGSNMTSEEQERVISFILSTLKK